MTATSFCASAVLSLAAFGAAPVSAAPKPAIIVHCSPDQPASCIPGLCIKICTDASHPVAPEAARPEIVTCDLHNILACKIDPCSHICPDAMPNVVSAIREWFSALSPASR